MLKCSSRLTAALNRCPSFSCSLSSRSGVDNYFQLRLSSRTDVCNVFHLLFIISFHILSGPALNKCYLVDVCVFLAVFGVDLKGLFLSLSVSLLKESLCGFYKLSAPRQCLTGQTYLNWKSAFLYLFFYCLIAKNTFLQMSVLLRREHFPPPLDQKCSSCYAYPYKLDFFLCLSIFFPSFSFLCISLHLWLLLTGLKMKSDAKAFFKGHHGRSRVLLGLAEKETCHCFQSPS